MEMTSSGLYATHLYVRPNEATDYETMRAGLLAELRPHGAFEESFALRIINATWRLRRCDAAERAIPEIPSDSDSTTHDFENSAQTAINRARAAAETTIRRTMKDLAELQAERWRRATLKLTGPIDPQELGLAPFKAAAAAVPSSEERQRLHERCLAMESAPTHPFHPTLQNEPILPNEASSPAAQPRHNDEPGRNAPCPCNSGQKYKRCCGHWSKAA